MKSPKIKVCYLKQKEVMLQLPNVAKLYIKSFKIKVCYLARIRPISTQTKHLNN